jgi:hypothetical protein
VRRFRLKVFPAVIFIFNKAKHRHKLKIKATSWQQIPLSTIALAFSLFDDSLHIGDGK